jgi:hypothetical protein
MCCLVNRQAHQPPPDYAGQQLGKLLQVILEAAAQSATAANRVNQITPYGNLLITLNQVQMNKAILLGLQHKL